MPSVQEAADELARLFSGAAAGTQGPAGSDLEFLPGPGLEPLPRSPAPADCWAVDGGQALVADARCVQVGVTRAARARWQDGSCTLEEVTGSSVHVLTGSSGGERARSWLAATGAPVAAGAPVDLNLLRDWAEWRLVAASVEQAGPGALVLVDGDLQPDWRIPANWLARLLERAAQRQVVLVGVTKHSSLSRGGAPLVGQLEMEGARRLGPQACWWAPVASRRPELGPGLLVAVARLDPDARFAFRVDLPADAPAETVLGQLRSLSDDAAFPGYPYPLSMADRLAACPGWVRDQVRAELDAALEGAGVDVEARERAFADRHRLMERS